MLDLQSKKHWDTWSSMIKLLRY